MQSKITHAKRQGRQEGRQEGLQEGLVQGEARGMTKGEAKARREILDLLKSGKSVEDVIRDYS
jgi:flagellar biosynthesis/type III secretory pathway protein FliH